MSSLSFAVVDAAVEPHAAQPTMKLRLLIAEDTGATVRAVALQCQVRIEPQRRHYDAAEEERLVELFGSPVRWGETLRPFLWTHVSTVLGGFTGETTAELSVPCTYDMEIAATKYLHGLDADGEVPLVLLFSGTTFTDGSSGMNVTPVAWHEDASFRLPVRVWRDMMDCYFPNSGWVVLDRRTLDALAAFKAANGVPTWDLAVERLLKLAGEDV